MRTIFSIFSGIFLMGLIGCGGMGIRGDENSPKGPSAISASAIGSGKITIAWDLNRDDKTVGYRIYYGFFSWEYKYYHDIGKPIESSPGIIKSTLAGLEKGKRYYIAVIAYDKKKNMSTFSNEVSAIAE
jgi:hypothetical protein